MAFADLHPNINSKLYLNANLEGKKNYWARLMLPIIANEGENTLATKEQIQNGDIVAKSAVSAATASYASTANATSIGDKSLSEIFDSNGTTVLKAASAENTGFSNNRWVFATADSPVEVRDSALYEIVVDGLFLTVGFLESKSRVFDITTTAYESSTVLQYFDVYEASLSEGDATTYLTVSRTRYEARNLGGYMYWCLDSRKNRDFRYRRIG